MELYPFQKEAVAKMLGQPGFLLADSMGVGKTLMALSEIVESGELGPHLIVTLKSAIPHWKLHISLICPHLDFTVTNWAQLPRGNFSATKWGFVVADECHFAKNKNAQRTKALKRIPARYKRGLSGTPVINRPDELWSILHWLYPKDFKSYWRWYEEYVDYSLLRRGSATYRVINGAKNAHRLRAVIEPFYLRRLKSEVLADLPPKLLPVTHTVPLSGPQRRAYEEMRQQALAWVGPLGDEPVPAPVAIARMTRLRQLCGAYATASVSEVRLSEPSAKLDVLMDILGGTDEPVVVFSGFRQMVDLACARFEKRGIDYIRLAGDTPDTQRGRWQDFQKGEGRVFIATIQTGGAGIDLFRANTVVFLDRSWSPADNSQAEDRLHRYGQNNPVTPIYIVAENTIDTYVGGVISWKANMIKQMLGK